MSYFLPTPVVTAKLQDTINDFDTHAITTAAARQRAVGYNAQTQGKTQNKAVRKSYQVLP